MKKFWKSLAAFGCAAVAAVGLVGCQEKIISAYDIAVENGFVGTEKEWLASLQGSNGSDGQNLNIQDVYAAALTDGFQGSFSDFLKTYFQLSLSENNDTATIAKNVSSVVSVCCAFTKTTTSNSTLGGTQKSITASGSQGSGVFFELDQENGNALIVTNYHVLYNADSDAKNGISDCVYIYPYGARNYFTTGADATGRLTDVNKDGVRNGDDQGDFGGDGIRAYYVGGAMDYDIAILRVSGSEYLKRCAATEAKLGNSNALSVGEKVFAVGNANGEGIAVTNGVVSVESENIAMSSLANANKTVKFRVIRTDAAINHGNSGGALFNAFGELIGITNAKNVEDETDNMGYALPISQVEKVYENILANDGVVKCATLGVNVLTEESLSSFDENGKLVVTEKVTIAQVASVGSAAYNKLKLKDVFVWFSVGGKRTEITRSYQLLDALLTVRLNDELEVGVLRDGSEVTVKICFDNEAYFKTCA